MNRRRLIQGLVGSGLLGNPAADAVPSAGIVDAHVHFYDPARPQGVPWPSPKENLLYRTVLPGPWAAMVRPMGVSGVIVVEASPWLEDNQWVLDIAARYPIVLGFVGHLEPGKSDFGRNLERFRRNPLFRGIRIPEQTVHTALESTSVMRDLQRLADADLALDVLGNGPMLVDVAKLSDRIPDLRIVVDHLPFESPAGSLQALRGRTRVFAKVSGVLRKVNGRVQDEVSFYRDSLDELWDVFGASRVIYASNYPVCELVASYATVLKVVREYFEAKGADASAKYFRTNSLEAYRWVERK